VDELTLLAEAAATGCETGSEKRLKVKFTAEVKTSRTAAIKFKVLSGAKPPF